MYGLGLRDPAPLLLEQRLTCQTPTAPSPEPGKEHLVWARWVCWSLSDQVLLGVDVTQHLGGVEERELPLLPILLVPLITEAHL